MIDPQPDFHPEPLMPTELAPGLRRILAPNPSPMTYRGTNTYLVGAREVAVIDPGPADARHMQAILSACAGARISHILVTHAHLDHSPLARPLAQASGARIYAFGKAAAGRSSLMENLARNADLGGGEGVDDGFMPDHCLPDGAMIETGEWALRAVHTPGHMASHMSFALEERLFSGDLVMGWASSLVSPPDGDLSDFMNSLRHLARQRWEMFYPGHGAPVCDPAGRLAELIAHREARSTAILDVLGGGSASPAQIAARIYKDTPAALLPAATRNVLAHLIDLSRQGRVTAETGIAADANFYLQDISGRG